MFCKFMTAATEKKDLFFPPEIEASLTDAQYILAALTVWQRNQFVFHGAS